MIVKPSVLIKNQNENYYLKGWNAMPQQSIIVEKAKTHRGSFLVAAKRGSRDEGGRSA